MNEKKKLDPKGRTPPFRRLSCSTFFIYLLFTFFSFTKISKCLSIFERFSRFFLLHLFSCVFNGNTGEHHRPVSAAAAGHGI